MRTWCRARCRGTESSIWRARWNVRCRARCRARCGELDVEFDRRFDGGLDGRIVDEGLGWGALMRSPAIWPASPCVACTSPVDPVDPEAPLASEAPPLCKCSSRGVQDTVRTAAHDGCTQQRDRSCGSRLIFSAQHIGLVWPLTRGPRPVAHGLHGPWPGALSLGPTVCGPWPASHGMWPRQRRRAAAAGGGEGEGRGRTGHLA